MTDHEEDPQVDPLSMVADAEEADFGGAHSHPLLRARVRVLELRTNRQNRRINRLNTRVTDLEARVDIALVALEEAIETLNQRDVFLAALFLVTALAIETGLKDMVIRGPAGTKEKMVAAMVEFIAQIPPVPVPSGTDPP